jgi:hypothetical protein
MTTANCDFTLEWDRVVGAQRWKCFTFKFTTYATGGIAIDPYDDLGFLSPMYICAIAPGFCPGKGFYHYDGTTLKVYVDADTEVEDNTDAGSAKMVLMGK